MQISIGKIQHFDYLSHISVNFLHTQKGILGGVSQGCERNARCFLMHFC